MRQALDGYLVCDCRKGDARHGEGKSNFSKGIEVGKHATIGKQVRREIHVIPYNVEGSMMFFRRCIRMTFYSPIVEGFSFLMCHCIIPWEMDAEELRKG